MLWPGGRAAAAALICVILHLVHIASIATAASVDCPHVSKASCCTARFSAGCTPKYCYKWVSRYCPDRKVAAFGRRAGRMKAFGIRTAQNGDGAVEKRRAPGQGRSSSTDPLTKCGTAERNYQPCTTKGIANKLFQACCQLYVPSECHFMCVYETDQTKTRQMFVELVQRRECSLRYLSAILYCASQNRDNRRCCADLDLNAPQLQVGSRCLRMCDPSGTAIERITKQDVTCLYNWNVIMYCHHSGIREM